MNNVLRAVLLFMLNRKYIGGRHTPENKLIKSKTKWIDAKERKIFEKEYKEMINNEFILRSRKRTGKCSENHIYLNPRKLKELYEMLVE